MCWFGTSGAGKGCSLRVLLSREHFANGLRVYGIDQDEQQEYAGRFCDYLGGSRVPIRGTDDAAHFSFTDVANPDVVIFDLHESAELDRGAIFATLKAHLVAHLLANPSRAAFVVDEAVTVTEDELGARTIGDLVRRGRHFGLEVHVLTQRVTDWFDSRIGRTIQPPRERRGRGGATPEGGAPASGISVMVTALTPQARYPPAWYLGQ